MKQQKVFLMCGPAGSGKSRFATRLMQPETDILLSRDNLRFSILKEGEDYFAREGEVRRRFAELISNHTSNDEFENIFIDATHLTPKARRVILSNIKNNPYIIAISLEVPVEVAIERNANREGLANVPESVIRNMHHSYVIPKLAEGFDEVWHVDAEGGVRKEIMTSE